MYMTDQNTEAAEFNFSEESIQEQIQKIFKYHPFAVSVVLRNFLLYIVNETISGRSNDIKEYNIAVSVLKKPVNFRTEDSGIVRVHARRLRRALHAYYREMGEMDPCIISIPTGRYMPVFTKQERPGGKTYPELKSVSRMVTRDKIRMAVLPFHCFEQDVHRMAFADSIGLMLNEGLGSSPGLSLISYFTTQQLRDKLESIPKLVTAYGLEYVLTGNVHFQDSKIRVNFQLVHAQTEVQLFSETSYWHFSSGNYFELSNTIVSNVMTTLRGINDWQGQESMKNLVTEPFRRVKTAIA